MPSKDSFIINNEKPPIVYIRPILKSDSHNMNALDILYFANDNNYKVRYNRDEHKYKDLNSALNEVKKILSTEIISVTKLKWSVS